MTTRPAPKYAANLLPSRPDPRHHDRDCKRHGGCQKCEHRARRHRAPYRGLGSWVRISSNIDA